jgi:hypothetical protein
MGRVDFTMDRHPFQLSTEEIDTALRDAVPEPIQQLAVRHGDQWWPVKQAFGRALGISNTKFNSRKAFDVLRRLGLPVHDVKRDGPLPSSGRSSRNGRVNGDIGARALELAVAASNPPHDVNDIITTADRFRAWLAKEE